MSSRVSRIGALIVLLAAFALTPAGARENDKPELLVFAAASLTNVIERLRKTPAGAPGNGAL